MTWNSADELVRLINGDRDKEGKPPLTEAGEAVVRCGFDEFGPPRPPKTNSRWPSITEWAKFVDKQRKAK